MGMAIDLEAMGIGGKSGIFQYLFSSATDFQVYKEVDGLSGFDFAYADNTAVYHTKATFRINGHLIPIFFLKSVSRIPFLNINYASFKFLDFIGSSLVQMNQ